MADWPIGVDLDENSASLRDECIAYEGMGTGDCNGGKVKCHDVKTVQLDNFMYGPMKSFSKSKIRVLKVDVEGFDGDVLKTMSQVFEKNDVENILFESIHAIYC